MGDVVVPFAVTFSTLAIVITPPRWLSGGSATLRNPTALHARDPVVGCQPPLSIEKSDGHDVRQAQVVLEELRKNSSDSRTIESLSISSNSG
jgi:hypothetical protein